MDDCRGRRSRPAGGCASARAHVALADLVMADRDVEALIVRGGRATAHADDDLAHVLAAHLLGRRHRRRDARVAASMSTMLPERMPWAG